MDSKSRDYFEKRYGKPPEEATDLDKENEFGRLKKVEQNNPKLNDGFAEWAFEQTFGYPYKAAINTSKHKVPEGKVKCTTCGGYGWMDALPDDLEKMPLWDGPPMPNDDDVGF